MKLDNKMLSILVISLIFVPGMATATSVPHTSYPNAKDWVPNVPYSCANQMDETNVSQILAIQAGTSSASIAYNTTQLYANVGACVKFVLVDIVDMHHDFVIDKITSTGNIDPMVQDANLSRAEINTIDMDVMNSTYDIGFGPGINIFYAWMPQVPSHFTYYCSLPGHEANGMRGTLWVEASNSGTSSSSQSSSSSSESSIAPTPGFGVVELFLGSLCVVIIQKNRNKKK